ncbi:potassium transporter Kup [Candidatus Dependentiae bacterium]|nr:potassium transporter Kup [Candidatus Dependentiae bacterium]
MLRKQGLLYFRQESLPSLTSIIKSMGLVFGDIGTSPVYTMTAVFLTLPNTPSNVLGVTSLICWSLFLLFILEYTILAMSLSKKGEGGTIVLREILAPLLKNKKTVGLISLLSYIGLSLLVGDGIITPAINVLSAVEGVMLIPFFKGIPQEYLLLAACCIAVFLFSIQKRGTEKVALAFGPIMVIWFSVLAISGVIAITSYPTILSALSPWTAIQFFSDHFIVSFFVLADVILCATGCEAMYADMGHLGRNPIRFAAYIVTIALTLTYLGQGAFLITNPQVKFVFYELIYSQLGNALYIVFLCLNFCAFVIASQAIISGLFSIVYQGIMTKILPKMKVEYTSSNFRSQIYVGFVNWSLLFAVLVLVSTFKASYNLTIAYGLAVTGTMLITGIMMTLVFYLRKKLIKASLAATLTFINAAFLASNLYKIPLGGYISILLALIPLTLILIYTQGQQHMVKALRPKKLEDFLEKYQHAHQNITHIKGTALFFTQDLNAITPFITQTMFKNNIVYEDNILVSIVTRDDPFGIISFFKGELAPGLRIFEIHMGYLEIIDIEKILLNANIHAKVIFYGLEEIVSQKAIWQIYALIKKVTPNFVQFYKLPPYKLHGVVTLVEM